VQNDYDIEQPRSRCRQPLNPGEELCAGLPGMRISLGTLPWDFRYLPENLYIEVKYRSHPNEVPSAGGATHQFIWGDIGSRHFNWLLLMDEYKYLPYFFLLKDWEARHFMTPTRGGQITWTVDGVRKSRAKSLEFYRCRVSYNTLLENCRNGTLGSL